ncbi:MAG: uroporphyrinogen-III C-methyltransferase [Colwelliaceae bacterium]|nr:uroporphyrinogen-III C-methyltransferase [Colwelliaceae bacterium]
MTDINKPTDTSNSEKDDTNSSIQKDSTQTKLEQLTASIEAAKPEQKATSTVHNKTQKTKQPSSKNKSSTSSTKNMTDINTKRISKTAVIALIIALASATGVGSLYYLNKKENQIQSEEIISRLTAMNSANEQRIKQLIADQKVAIEHQVSDAITEISNANQARISQLEQQINLLKQNQPSDWLIHEAEYLIRIASRTIWLEHDTTAAINLLKDADARIKELNDPQFLSIRQLIREDIEALKLMPTLNTEEVILSLLAMNKQLPKLSFSMANIPESQTVEQDLELSQDTADWRSNLAKTWQKFLDDFITIRRRAGDIEPLMSPNNQQNLKENLALKIQQAQWAASEEKPNLFTQSLNDIQQWLTQYFDLGHLETAKFYQGIQLLKNETISYDYPSKLLSLNAIRKVLSAKTLQDNIEKNILPKDDKPTDNNLKTEKELPVQKEQVSEQKVTREDA